VTLTGLGAAFLLPVVMGMALIGAVWTPSRRPSPSLLLTGPLALGLGLGLSAAAFFAWLAGGGRPGLPFLGVELALAALLVAVCVTRARMTAGNAAELADARPGAPPATRRPVLVFLGLAAASAAAAFAAQSLSSPHGGWDAWMTWNMRARFMFRGGDDWRAAFSPLAPWSHPDYPFVLPALVARSWAYLGDETTAVPILTAALFAAATTALLYGALRALRSPEQGALGLIVLLGTQFFVTHGASQYADVPLAFFVLATLVLLCLQDRVPGQRAPLLALAGLAAGLAACTKNEGLLFLVALAVARVASVVPSSGWRAAVVEAGFLGLGAGPALLVLAYFKAGLAPPNDLLSAQSLAAGLGRLTEASRYAAVLRGFRETIAGFGANGLPNPLWLLFVYLISVGVAAREARRPGVRTAVLALGLMLAAHFLLFLIVPGDMPRLLASSLDRLILQLWPGAVLTYFLAACTPEEAGG
jgi:hypothetical protein